MSHTWKHVAIAGVSGSFSSLGYQIAQEFVHRKYHVSLLVRSEAVQDADKKKKLESLHGAHIVVADFYNKDQLTEVLKGVDLVISALGGQAIFQGQINLIEASKAAGVKRFVPSEFGIDLSRLTLNAHDNNGFPLFAGKVAVEDAVKKSGLEYTLVRTGFFPDTTFTNPGFGFDVKGNKVSIVGDGYALVSWTLTSDVAKVLPDILESPKSKNTAVHIAGEQATINDVLKEIEAVTGKKLDRTHTTAEETRQKIIADASGGWQTVPEQLVLSLETGYALFHRIHNSDFPFHPTPIKEWVKKTFH